MHTKISKLLFATLSVLSAALPSWAAEGPDQSLLAFCSTVRDEYVSNVKQKYQSQRYQGSGGAGAGISKSGISFGGRGAYDWSRTWSEMSDSKRSEYESKNCDVALQQWGAVSVAEIQADAAVAVERMKNDTLRHSADTQRLIADINATAAVDVAKINADVANNVSKDQLDAIKDTNATNLGAAGIDGTVAINHSGNQLAATQDTNRTNVAIEKMRVDVAKKQGSNQLVGGVFGTLGNVIGSSIIASANRNQQNQAAAVEREKIQAQLEIAKINAQTERMKIAAASNATSAADQLLAQWGWTKVACYQGAVFILGVNPEAVCVHPDASVMAGQYTFDRATNQLIPANSIPAQTPVSPEVNIIPAQTTAPQDGGF